MSTNWKNWCRLCAKHEEHEYDVFFKVETITELSQLVEKYFLISISPYDGTPSAICSECYKFISKLEKFAIRCSNVDKMFAELVYDNVNILEKEINLVRIKYGLDDEKKLKEEILHNSTKPVVCYKSQPINFNDQATDTIDLLTAVENDVSVFRIKEENVQQHPSIAVGRKRRGRPKKNETTIQSDYIEMSLVKEEREPEQNYESTEHIDYQQFDIPVDMPSSSEGSEFDINEMKEELNNLKEENEEDIPDVLDDDDDEDFVMPKQKQKKKFECTQCDLSWDVRRAYTMHMRKEHQVCSFQYRCDKCPKRFMSEMKLKSHEVVHLPESQKLIHACPYCDKKFTKSVNVQAHVRTVHIGDRPFICEECGKSFGTKGALKEHQITHSDERPYQCSSCPKKFKNLPRLKTHEDIHNATVYVCPHCGLQLNTKRTLKMHMVVHSDQKKYKCQYCGNEYKRSKALKNHLILHTGLRPYMCPFCDKTFANGSNCRSHKKKSHPLELAALEASGEVQRATNIPKLEHLQPKKYNLLNPPTTQDLIDAVVASNTSNFPLPMQLPKLEEDIKSDDVPIVMEPQAAASTSAPPTPQPQPQTENIVETQHVIQQNHAAWTISSLT